MKVWIMHGTYESEAFSSVHFTEKGCALAGIAAVLEFLGVDSKEEALRVMNDHYAFTETDGEQTEPLEWDYNKLKDMTREDLWKVFNDWTENSWEYMADRSYYISANAQMIQP